MGGWGMRIVKSSQLGKQFFEYKEPKDVAIVKQILLEVRLNGDAGVKKYTKKFDNIKLRTLEVPRKLIKEAYEQVDKETLRALKGAAKNIKAFAKKQLVSLKEFETQTETGILGQKIIPLERVGCYVPGGRYPLPSSALMSVMPAKVAGVNEVIVCSPKIKPITIVAADIAGADRIFAIGGVQAIGAMAYGTETVPRVDKIVGPGNVYVTAAKKEVYGEVGIDFLAGPSEVFIIADASGDPCSIAADLLAQAEHDVKARPDLVTTSKKLATCVLNQLKLQLAQLRTKGIAQEALRNGRIVLVSGLDEAAQIANQRAPEHLELQVRNPQKIIRKLRNYGSLFIGKYTAEVFGDYCSGTNHILPTNGAARYTGGLSVKDFVKVLTYQKISKMPSHMISIASTLAEAEGLDAHRKAAEMRRIYKSGRKQK